jgi:hypothetical protein
MTTYPCGEILPLGLSNLMCGIDENVWYTSPDGESIFYFAGGLQPWPGVTDGMVLTGGLNGLAPGFKHLDQQGAMQDGVTWQETLYDPAEMIAQIEAHANTAEGLSALVSEWRGAWNPK